MPTSKTPLPDSTVFTIGVDQPAKAVVMAVSPAPDGPNLHTSVNIGNVTGVDLGKRQSIVGTLECLLRYAMSHFDKRKYSGSLYTISMPTGGTEDDIITNGSLESGYTFLAIGNSVNHALQLQVAFDHLKAAFLEASQGN